MRPGITPTARVAQASLDALLSVARCDTVGERIVPSLEVGELSGGRRQYAPMPITRDHLYEQVWAKPMLAVAGDYEVSANYLARARASRNVPCQPSDALVSRCLRISPVVIAPVIEGGHLA